MDKPLILHAAETIKGGVATVLSELLEAQVSDYGVTNVIALIPSGQRSEIRSCCELRIDQFARPTARTLRGMWSFAYSFAALVVREKPALVHLHSTFAGLVGRVVLALLILWRRPKVVYSPHGFSFLMRTPHIKRMLYVFVERMMLAMTDKVVCVSHYERSSAIRFGLEAVKMQTIYNGVRRMDPVDDASRAEALGPSPLRVLFVGRLDYQKGVDVLLRAIALLPPEAVDVRIVGAGVLENPELPMMGNVTYVGWVAAGELGTYYRTADVVVMPSRWEGFGLVAVEAQMSGTPVLASNNTSLPEVVKDGVGGYLFPTDDHAELARVIAETDRMVWRSLGRTGRARCMELFSAARMTQEVNLLYRQVGLV